jgi:hypothetical protein
MNCTSLTPQHNEPHASTTQPLPQECLLQPPATRKALPSREQLSRLLRSAHGLASSHGSTRVSRHIRTPRASVYRALLDARAIANWVERSARPVRCVDAGSRFVRPGHGQTR